MKLKYLIPMEKAYHRWRISPKIRLRASKNTSWKWGYHMKAEKAVEGEKRRFWGGGGTQLLVFTQPVSLSLQGIIPVDLVYM